MQKRNVLYLMTYADNLALGYFRKQGFSKDIITPLDLWDGYIKDYEGGTKMEYWIDSKIDYLRINKIIQDQKKYFLS